MVVAIDSTSQWTPDQSGGYAFHSVAVEPSDTDELNTVINRLYVGVSGDITLVMVGDVSSVLLKSVPVGLLSGLRIRKIFATGTTATNLIGFY